MLFGIVGLGPATAMAQEAPEPIVSYDFSTESTGASTVANSVKDSSFGEAVITDADGETTGVFEDGALQMDGGYCQAPRRHPQGP